MHEDGHRLIPRLSQWNNGAGIDLSGFLSAIARYDHAIAYATTFWPDFVLCDDCVFLHDPDLSIYHDWLKRCNGDKPQAESVMNHHHNRKSVVEYGEDDGDLGQDFLGYIITVRQDRTWPNNTSDRIAHAWRVRERSR